VLSNERARVFGTLWAVIKTEFRHCDVFAKGFGLEFDASVPVDFRPDAPNDHGDRLEGCSGNRQHPGLPVRTIGRN